MSEMGQKSQKLTGHQNILTYTWCYLGYFILTIFGYFRDLLISIGLKENPYPNESNRIGFVPLFDYFSTFYKRNMYRIISDVFNSPIASMAGPHVDLLERTSDNNNHQIRLTGRIINAINMASYNYLGLNQNEGPVKDKVEDVIKQRGVSVGTSRTELGTFDLHVELEQLVSRFIGVEDAVVYGMGFATNTTCIPSLIGPGCLVLSDEYNHSSIALGCRLSKAVVKIFKHNNMSDLEHQLRNGILNGQPKSHHPWKKILIIIEGIYSMEGTIINLPEIIRLKKKYKAYIFLDEAHSIGCLGKHGRGIIDYYGMDAKDIDLMMGTFTKSFGAAGGYIGGNKRLISHLRRASHASSYANSMAAPIVQQVISTMKIIMGEEEGKKGKILIETLARNTKYFREQMKKRGFLLKGNEDSPVVPTMLYHPAKLGYFIRELKKRGVAVAGVGFPATPLTELRARFCMSAGHSIDDLDKVLDTVDEVGIKCDIKFLDE